MSLPDYYATLQIDPNAEPEIVEAAYRRLAARLHPDVNPSRGAAERMRVINEAFHVLGDPERRRAYDLLRNSSLRPPVPPAVNAQLGENRPPDPVPAQVTPIVCANCGHRFEQSLQGRDAYNCGNCGRRFTTLLGTLQQVQSNLNRGLLSSRRTYRVLLAMREGRQLVQFAWPQAEPLPLRENETLLLHFDLTRQLVLIQNVTSRLLYRPRAGA